MMSAEGQDHKSTFVQIAALYNGVASNVTLHRSSAVVVPTAPRATVAAARGDALGDVLPYQNVQQVLVSRKRPCQVRVVIEGSDAAAAVPPVDILFESTGDRDLFMAALATASESAKGIAKAESITAAITSPPPAISSQVSTGILGASVSELDTAAVHDEIRGAVHVFEAINALIDVTTLTLRPVTEQLEMDILRQLPILAEVFIRRVKSEEDHRSFWEAVVKKFFCFTKSYLDLDFSSAGPLVASGAPSTTTMAEQVNRAGAAALPLARQFKADDQPYDLPDVDNVMARIRRTPHQELFLPTPRVSAKRVRTETATDEGRIARRESAEAVPQPVIAYQVPPSAKAPETIKLLRQFWIAAGNRLDVQGPVEGLMAQLPSLVVDSVLHRCVVAALSHSGK
jgi:hypothetical protein